MAIWLGPDPEVLVQDLWVHVSTRQSIIDEDLMGCKGDGIHLKIWSLS
tara:strand:+ start:1848 stop:1991 length:144 start_codon:yes stop_codon:yes gene_type:complete